MSQEKIFVTRSSMPSLEEYVQEIKALWESHFLTNMGEKHQEFERLLRDYLGVEGIALFVNGHNALECVLEAMQLKGKVVTTPFTFASTTHAIVRKGLTPVFADIDPKTFTVDPQKVEDLIDEETCAILPVHVYGNLCDVDALKEIADKHNLKLIYDAAHAFGVSRNGVSSATFGDASMFSFHATKVFNTIEGGAVCFHDPHFKTILDHWKNFGISGLEQVEFIGGNAKMNEFCAAMGICNLRHLSDEIAKRKLVAERYWDNLEGVPGITVFRPQPDIEANYAYLPVVFSSEFGATRDDVYAALKSHEIYARKYFYPLTSQFTCYKGKFPIQETPVAAYAASHVLTLPMFADLSFENVDRICNIVLSCKR